MIINFNFSTVSSFFKKFEGWFFDWSILKWVCYLYWYDRFGLFRENHASIEEWRYYVVNQEMNSGFVLLIKLLVIVDLLHSSTAQHPVYLPGLVVLGTRNDIYYTFSTPTYPPPPKQIDKKRNKICLQAIIPILGEFTLSECSLLLKGCCFQNYFYETRMHSSSIRTTCSLTVCHSILLGLGMQTPLGSPPPWMQTPPRQNPPWCIFLLDVDPLPPWSEGMTHACENITFSQLLLQVVIKLAIHNEWRK